MNSISNPSVVDARLQETDYLDVIRRYKNRQLDKAKLTIREREVCELCLKGLSDKEMAQSLGISYKTVKHHLAEIRAKFGVSSRSELSALVFGML